MMSPLVLVALSVLGTQPDDAPTSTDADTAAATADAGGGTADSASDTPEAATSAAATSDAPGAASATASANATEPATATATRPKNLITVNLPSNLFGAYSVEFVHAFNDNLSLFIEPTYFNIPAQPGVGLGISGPGVVVGAMVHPLGEAPDGLFIAPELYLTALDSQADGPGSNLGLGTGLLGGWTWRFWEYLAVSAGLGGTVNLVGYNLGGAPRIGRIGRLFKGRHPSTTLESAHVFSLRTR